MVIFTARQKLANLNEVKMNLIVKFANLAGKSYSIGFPGQIRQFDTQIHFNFIQIRQILSCRESYDSNSFSYHSI